jgi:hypothetical protein
MLGESIYSETELKLIRHFGFENAVGHVLPALLYPMMASKAFMMNDQTQFASALRRCLLAFEKGAYRGTPEWDALIGDPQVYAFSRNDPEDDDDFGGK